MDTSILIRLIKTFEGLCKVKADGLVYPYICPAGFPTQGYGVLVKDMNVAPITKQEAEDKLMEILPYYINKTLQLCPVLIKHPEKLQAITDFTFNLGAGRLKASTLRKRINSEDWQGANVELQKWVRGGGRILPGLVKRRKAEGIILLGELK